VQATGTYILLAALEVELLPLTLELGVVEMFLDKIGHPGGDRLGAGSSSDSPCDLFGDADGDTTDRHNIKITYTERSSSRDYSRSSKPK